MSATLNTPPRHAQRSATIAFLAVALALAACAEPQPAASAGPTPPAPGAAPAVAAPPAPDAALAQGMPHLLDPAMAAALKIQTAIVADARDFVVDASLPLPPIPGEPLAIDAAPAPEATVAPDERKIAIFFAGHEVGELEPCG